MNIGDLVAIRSYFRNDYHHIGLIIDTNDKSCLIMWAENNRPTGWWRNEWLEVYNEPG